MSHDFGLRAAQRSYDLMSPVESDLEIATDWHTEWDQVSLLCKYLVHTLGFSAEELLAVLEEPWNWTDEYAVALQESLAEQRTTRRCSQV